METVAVVLALRVWGKHLSGKHLISFIDNEGSKYSLVRGYSDSPSITFLCGLADAVIDEHRILAWFSRVPSYSNIADAPSRGEAHELLRDSCRGDASNLRRSLQDIGRALAHERVGG